MTRFFLSSIFAAFLVMGLSPAVQAEDAAPAAEEKKAEEPKAEEKKEEKAEAKTEEKKEDKTAEEKPAADEIPKGVAEHQKAAQEVFELTRKIAEGLSPENQKHFFLIYNNYNLIGTVKMVQGDVGNAVTACGKENPDMKEAMSARFATWNNAVNPVIKEAEGNVDNMVIAQDYAKAADIKKVFKGLDKTRKLANAQIEKTPVTTKEACQYLLNTMDDTQENFIRLLRSTLVSAPAALPETASGKKAESKSEEEPKAEDKEEEKKAEDTRSEDKKSEDAKATEPAAGDAEKSDTKE